MLRALLQLIDWTGWRGLACGLCRLALIDRDLLPGGLRACHLLTLPLRLIPAGLGLAGRLGRSRADFRRSYDCGWPGSYDLLL